MNDKIWTIRNEKVMLDSYLAKLCQIETKVFNQSIKRNVNLFSKNSRFQLTNEEKNSLRSQNVTLKNRGNHSKFLPFAFTKEGVEIAVKILKKDIDIGLLFEEKLENDLIIQNDDLRSKIHNIRGMQVMLDFDLALLYKVTTARLKEQVKRNPKRFPNDFMFQLSDDEINLMVSQNAIPSKQILGGAKPFAFTEQGISSLSSVLTSNRAIEININIMRTFVEMRQFIANNATVFQRLTNIEQNLIANNARLDDTDNNFDKIFKAIEENEIKPKQGIFYNGQMFDAYKLTAEIIRSAKKSIIVIDNYIDESTLLLFSKRNKKVKMTFYTKKITSVLKQDVAKYNSQYEPVEIKKLKTSHDRFLILDEKTVYHFGASLKDLGLAWFGFSKLDINANDILEKLN